ncbi:hypothetical protein D3C75_1052780 [compost metagenome]
MFTRVGVNARDRDPWMFKTDALEEGIRHRHHRFDPLGIQRIKELAQGDVGGNMDHLQLIGVQHHRIIPAVGQFCQQLRMAWIQMPGQMQRLFIQRRRGDGHHLTRHGQFGGTLYASVSQIARLCLHFPRCQRCGIL